MFPEMFSGFLHSPVPSHAIAKRAVEVEIVDIRSYAEGSYRHIDDSPYGGGAGMILRCEPVIKALEDVKTPGCHTILMAAAGFPYTQMKAHEYASLEHLVILCGHYEGVDARILNDTDECISCGDYIVTGGEYPSMIIADSVIRLLDGVIRHESIEEESYENGLLEYPQYTRPAVFNGEKVPDVLLSGNHEAVRRWRLQESLRTTLKYRPDLLENRILSPEEAKLLEKIK